MAGSFKQTSSGSFHWLARFAVSTTCHRLVISLFSTTLVSTGLMVSNTVVNVYLVDAFTSRSASVVSLSNFVRAVFAAITPLFAVQMVDALGNGWTFTTVGLIYLVSSVLPALVYAYGARWRPTS